MLKVPLSEFSAATNIVVGTYILLSATAGEIGTKNEDDSVAGDI